MAIGVGSVVLNDSGSGGQAPALIGQVIAANGGNWDVLWQGGNIGLNVPGVALFEFVTVACSLRPAVRLNAAGVTPAPDAVGMVIAQTATRVVIRTPTGYQYSLPTTQVKFLD